MATAQELQELLGKKRLAYGHRVAQLPQFESNLRQQVYGGEKILPELRQRKDEAIMQLWETDKRLAERYAKPESEMFIRDPYKREQIVAGQHQDIYGQVSNLTRLQEARQDLLGDIMEKGLSIHEAGLRASQQEFDMISTELNNLLRIQTAQERKRRTTQPKADLPGLLRSLTKPQAPGEGPQYSPLKPEQTVEKGGKKWQYDPKTGQWRDIAGLQQLNLSPELLSYIGSVPDLSEDVAERYLNQILFPGQQKTKTEASLKRQVATEAYNAKLGGASTEEIVAYIQSQGLSPDDPDFASLLY